MDQTFKMILLLMGTGVGLGGEEVMVWRNWEEVDKSLRVGEVVTIKGGLI